MAHSKHQKINNFYTLITLLIMSIVITLYSNLIGMENDNNKSTIQQQN
jgi:hypothetical protein